MKRSIGQDEKEIDRILAGEEEILPSSGFAVYVMDAVRREAAAPPPIAFPWKRALPGLVVGAFAVALVLVAVVVAIARAIGASATAQFSVSFPSVLTPTFGFQHSLETAASWTVLALVVTFVSVKLSMRLTSGRA
jgi:predicted benzoate:H+ symporter BenE